MIDGVSALLKNLAHASCEEVCLSLSFGFNALYLLDLQSQLIQEESSVLAIESAGGKLLFDVLHVAREHWHYFLQLED